MGGRSRQPKDERVSSYAFVSELSDSRLEAYGRFTSASYQNLDGGSLTQHGVPKAPDTFNHHLADEYRRRTGDAPNWDIRINDAEKHHRKNAGFKE
jgi:hypothetical protein